MPTNVRETVPRPYYSAEMVRSLPQDSNRYETVHGELLVTPALRVWHQEIEGRLYEALRPYLRTHPVGHVFASRSDISWSPDTLVEPDVFVVSLDEARTLDWAQMRDPLLVAEVLSPSSSRADRFTKRRLYQEQRVPLYWIIDADERQVEVWVPDAQFPAIERERLHWLPLGASQPFTLELRELFRPI